MARLEQHQLSGGSGDGRIDPCAADRQAWAPHVDHARHHDDRLLALQDTRGVFLGAVPEVLDQILHGASSGLCGESETPFVSGAPHGAEAQKQRSRARVNDRPEGVRSTCRIQLYRIRQAVVYSRAAKRHVIPLTVGFHLVFSELSS